MFPADAETRPAAVSEPPGVRWAAAPPPDTQEVDPVVPGSRAPAAPAADIQAAMGGKSPDIAARTWLPSRACRRCLRRPPAEAFQASLAAGWPPGAAEVVFPASSLPWWHLVAAVRACPASPLGWQWGPRRRASVDRCVGRCARRRRRRSDARRSAGTRGECLRHQHPVLDVPPVAGIGCKSRCRSR